MINDSGNDSQPILLNWINFNTSMDNQLHTWCGVKLLIHLFIPEPNHATFEV